MVCLTLVGVSVYSSMCSRLLIMLIDLRDHQFMYECQSVECAFTSPVSIEPGILMMS